MFRYKFNYSKKDLCAPLNWQHFLTHYVFEPWRRETNSLVRLFRFPSQKLGLVRVNFSGSTKKPQVYLEVLSQDKLSEDDINWIKKLVSWCFDFGSDVSHFYDDICQKDPVLKAASAELYGAKLRTDPDVFESVLGVVMAQNVQFSRIYQMTRLLVEKFGDKAKFNGKLYYTFPEPERLAQAPLASIRACKVGYRDKYIKGIAQYVVTNKLNLNDLRQWDNIETIREELIKLPGVGPYTADLSLAIGFRQPTFHLDLFSREAMYTFYFKGKHVADDKLIKFVDQRWGNWKHHAMLLLTTNTDEWAPKLGAKFRLKSGAKSDNR